MYRQNIVNSKYESKYYRNNYGYKKNYKNNKYRYYNNYNKPNYNNFNNEEYSYDKETTTSSIGDNSFTDSSSINSRKQSIDGNEKIFYNNKNEQEKKTVTNTPLINLSEEDLKTAYFKPKSFKDSKEEDKKKHEIDEKAKKIENDDNFTILEIFVKFSKDKKVFFQLKKKDDVFEVAKQACWTYEISEEYINFFAYKIFHALHSIYGFYNLKLTDDEVNMVQKVKEKYNI